MSFKDYFINSVNLSKVDPLVSSLLYGFALLVLYMILYKLLGNPRMCDCGCRPGCGCGCQDRIKENFFFTVSNDNKCKGMYLGKPVSFDYTAVGSGDCKPLSYPPLGMQADISQCYQTNLGTDML